MRIAHIAPVIHPVPPATYGGTERVIADLATEQVAAGHEVAVFAPADSMLAGVKQIGTYHSLTWHKARHDDVPPGVPAELEACQLRDVLTRGSEFDVLHLHGSAHASAAAEQLGIPAFRTIHWRADELDHREHFRAFPGERVIAISESQARSVPAGSLAGVVHHGIPADRYRQGSGSGSYLAFLGRMTDQKRPDRAIELARLAGRDLQLAGPVDPGNPDYFDRVVAPSLGERIRHVGSIDDQGKQAFLGEAAALVFPIDWPEPFGLVMIEAMACGTPVIGWRQGSVTEVVDEGVTGIVVDSVEEAAARVGEVITLNRSTIRARFEERFSAGRMAEQTLALYREACSSRSSRLSSARSPSP
ncbi:glycosyltransferase family 4 protein [Qipengyuania atrilutea]|uniref:glycosyltransferase family 4 protein n=1 Tax=Qipengyuania atrilutea TaxID=2744473 RepID=UPI00298EB874|nr:glycosyltransferase family 4 protein [Actirhodobacter atriluteus]